MYAFLGVIVCLLAATSTVQGVPQARSENDIPNDVLEDLEEKLREDIVSKIRQKLNRAREMSLNEFNTGLDRELQPLDTDNISYEIAETGAMEDGRKRFSDVRAAESLLTEDQTDDENEETSVDRRAFWQLASMVSLTTGESSTKYLKYGCWCGPGGSGKPVDNLDKCCKEHDDCYVDEVKNKGCSKSYYFNIYKWQKDGSSVRCIKSSSSEKDMCLYRQCECDRIVADCLADHKDEYSNSYTGWWWLIKMWWKC